MFNQNKINIHKARRSLVKSHVLPVQRGQLGFFYSAKNKEKGQQEHIVRSLDSFLKVWQLLNVF